MANRCLHFFTTSAAISVRIPFFPDSFVSLPGVSTCLALHGLERGGTPNPEGFPPRVWTGLQGGERGVQTNRGVGHKMAAWNPGRVPHPPGKRTHVQRSPPAD